MTTNKYTAEYSASFRYWRKVVKKRGYDMSKLAETIDLLLCGAPMPPRYRDHALKGDYAGYRECHVGGEGNWLLIYKVYNDRLIFSFTSTGTHSDLFKGY